MKPARGWAAVGLFGLMLAFTARAEEQAPTGISPAEPAKSPAQVHHEPDPLFDDDYEDEEGDAEGGVPDPLEETNRHILGANRVMDTYFFDPITRGYAFTPTILKKGVRNIFSNLDSPAVFANDLLQLEWVDAGVTLARFVVNTTIGVAGFFDVAEMMGLEKHDSDFGQTLALAGVPSGAYMVMPILGPTTVRDGTGAAVDIAISPTVYLLGPVVLLYYGGSMGIALREENLQKIDALKSSSIDYYSALRSAWWQNRNAEVWSRREHRRADHDFGP